MRPYQQYYLNQIKDVYNNEGTEGKAAVITVALLIVGAIAGIAAAVVVLV